MSGLFVRLAISVSIVAVGTAGTRIVGPINDASRVVLPASVHPNAQPRYDQGRVDPSLQMPFITLVMKPSAPQQNDLDRLLVEQVDPSSPNYHRWLTPEQFGDRFSVMPRDYSTVVSWLESHQLHIEHLARARNWVAFSGAASSVELAFHTEIHRYLVDGQMHVANATEISVPAALQD